MLRLSFWAPSFWSMTHSQLYMSLEAFAVNVSLVKYSQQKYAHIWMADKNESNIAKPAFITVKLSFTFANNLMRQNLFLVLSLERSHSVWKHNRTFVSVVLLFRFCNRESERNRCTYTTKRTFYQDLSCSFFLSIRAVHSNVS